MINLRPVVSQIFSSLAIHQTKCSVAVLRLHGTVFAPFSGAAAATAATRGRQQHEEPEGGSEKHLPTILQHLFQVLLPTPSVQSSLLHLSLSLSLSLDGLLRNLDLKVIQQPLLVQVHACAENWSDLISLDASFAILEMTFLFQD